MAKRTKIENAGNNYSIEESVEVEVKYNAYEAALKLKLSEISKIVLLKKFPSETTTMDGWKAKLSKEKINF